MQNPKTWPLPASALQTIKKILKTLISAFEAIRSQFHYLDISIEKNASNILTKAVSPETSQSHQKGSQSVR